MTAGHRGHTVSRHRDTFFRPFRNIRPDDIITFTTLLGGYNYRVVPIKVVGSAPERFIVRAERVGNAS